jgi:Flp pilus assembly protein TadD
MDRQDWEDRLQRGWERFTAGDTQGALAFFQEACRSAPHAAEPFMQLGLAYEHLGQMSLALQQYRTAANLDPESASPPFALARLFRYVGDREAENAALWAASNKAVNNADRQMALGLLARQENNYAGALNHFQNATEWFPDYPWLTSAIGNTLLHLNRNAEAREALLQAVAQPPVHAQDLYDLGVAEQRLHNYADACAAFQKAVAVDPMFYKAYIALAALEARMLRWRSAWRHFCKAVEIGQKQS